MRSALVNVPVLLAPGRCRQHDVGELRCLGEEDVLDDDEEAHHRRGSCGSWPGRAWTPPDWSPDPQELDRPLFGVAEDLHRMGRRSPMRDLRSSTFHSRASSRTCSVFSQLRNPGRSPSAPASRLFWAVGWPFICNTPAPGRPIMPRIRWMLLTALPPRSPGWTGRSPARPSTAGAAMCRAAPPRQQDRRTETSQISATLGRCSWRPPAPVRRTRSCGPNVLRVVPATADQLDNTR